MSTDLKLYQSNVSPNSRRVRIYLAEKGICASTIPVDLGALEQFSDAYAAINSRRVIPTLVLGDGTAIGDETAHHPDLSQSQRINHRFAKGGHP
jgi:glutathione S-transferase